MKIVEKISMLLSKSSVAFFFILTFSLGVKKKRRKGNRLIRVNPIQIWEMAKIVIQKGICSPKSFACAVTVRRMNPIKKGMVPNTLIRWRWRVFFSLR